MSKAAHTRAREKTGEQTAIEALSVKGPIAEEIRMRAYYIYRERGGVDGWDLEDWLLAEHELREGGVETGAARIKD